MESEKFPSGKCQETQKNLRRQGIVGLWVENYLLEKTAMSARHNRSTRYGQDALGHSLWNQGMSVGQEGEILSHHRTDHEDDRSEGRTNPGTIQTNPGVVGPVDPGRTGLCSGQQAGQ